jgi:hypothetical protein
VKLTVADDDRVLLIVENVEEWLTTKSTTESLLDAISRSISLERFRVRQLQFTTIDEEPR